jgi:hypothetical protein
VSGEVEFPAFLAAVERIADAIEAHTAVVRMGIEAAEKRNAAREAAANARVAALRALRPPREDWT